MLIEVISLTDELAILEIQEEGADFGTRFEVPISMLPKSSKEGSFLKFIITEARLPRQEEDISGGFIKSPPKRHLV